MSPWLTVLRPHQWLKNLLVFAPLFFSGEFRMLQAGQASLAFVAFSFLASAGYCLNDLFDRERDRQHPVKQHRPIASGALSVGAATLEVFLAALAALLVALASGKIALLSVLALYAVAQFVYSRSAKHIPIVDLLFLSSFYVLRLLAGVVVTGIEPSTWILMFTWIAALMVAAGKRYLETSKHAETSSATRPVLCQYSSVYLRHLIAALAASTLICYLLWCNETVEAGRFLKGEILPSVLFVAYGVFRFQLLVFQRLFDEDPAVGFLKDAQIMTAVALFALYLSVVIYV